MLLRHPSSGPRLLLLVAFLITLLPLTPQGTSSGLAASNRTTARSTPPPPSATGYEVIQRARQDVVDLVYPDKAIALSGDTLAVLIDTYDQIYLYERNQGGPGAWGQTTIINAADIGALALQSSLALQGDTLVTATGTQVYIIERDQTNGWHLAQTLYAPGPLAGAGFINSLSFHGDQLVVGRVGDDISGAVSGSATLFTRDQSGQWQDVALLTPLDGAPQGLFGRSVAIGGSTIVVGAQGAAYTFIPDEDGRWIQQARLNPPPAFAGAHVGSTVAFAGPTILVAADGAVVPYDQQSDGSWLAGQPIRAPIPLVNWRFGDTLAAEGDLLVVGASLFDSDRPVAGIAFLFQRGVGGAPWGFLDSFTPDDSFTRDGFGRALAISGSDIAATSMPYGGGQPVANYIFEITPRPVLVADQFTTPEDTPLNLDVLSNDSAGMTALNPATLTITVPPSIGTAEVRAGSIHYQPLANDFSTGVQLTYQVKNIAGATATTTATITIERRDDDPPVLSPAEELPPAIATIPVTMTFSALDPDDDPAVRIDLLAGPPWLQLIPPDPAVPHIRLLVGTPPAEAVGDQLVRVQAIDSTGRATVRDYTLTVHPLLPPAPTGLAAQPEPNVIRLTWDRPEPTVSLIAIERRSQSDFWERINTLPARLTSYADYTFTCGAPNGYRLVALNGYAETAGSPIELTITPCPLQPPTDLTVTVEATTINLRWADPNQNEHGYRVERATAIGPWQLLELLSPSITGYEDRGAACATPYRYRVIASRYGWDRAASALITTDGLPCTLLPPTNLQVTQGPTATLDLRWEDWSTDETGYRIERSRDAGTSWQLLAETEPNQTSYRDKSLLCNTTVSYRVTAFKGAQTTEPAGPTVAASADRCAPTAPADFQVLSAGRYQITLSWADTSPNEEQFAIEVSTDNGQTWQQGGQAPAEATQGRAINLTCATSYSLRVIAVNPNGSSPPVGPAVMTTLACDGPIYVRADATGANTGISWDDAFRDLQDALADAAFGDSIWVAAGTYRPTSDTDRLQSFQLVNGVRLYGGFAGSETALEQRDWRANPTILSGNIGDPNSIGDNSESVVLAQHVDRSTLIDGFTVRDGNADGDAASRRDLGGGMRNLWANPTVQNSIFIANRADRGGGMGSYQASPVVRNVLFLGNDAREGGGMLNVDSSRPTLTQVVFSGNRSTSDGGAIANSLNSWATLNAATISTNSAAGRGAAIFSTATQASIVRNSVVWGNTAGVVGAPAQFVGLVEVSDAVLQHSLDRASAAQSVRYRIADPQFIDADGLDDLTGTFDDDLRLGVKSPAIDAGNNESLPNDLATDLNGNPRRIDHRRLSDTGLGAAPIVDRGAYEWQYSGEPPPTPVGLTVVADARVGALLSWTPVPDVEGYLVERSGPDGAWLTIARVDAPATTLRDRRLACATTYRYRMRAFNAIDFSARAAPVSLTTEGCSSVVLYVRSEASGTGGGRTWAEAYQSLAVAMDDARAGDTIWVAGGIYRPGAAGARNASFRLRAGVTVLGGFRGDETAAEQRDWEANPTVLSGDLAGNDPADLRPQPADSPTPYDENSYHVLIADEPGAPAVLDGVVVRGGNALGDPSIKSGGGILSRSANLVLRNSLITQHMARSGGAIFAHGGRLTLEDVRVVMSTAIDQGGGLFVRQARLQVRDTQIRLNSAGFGGGVALLIGDSRWERATIDDNRGGDGGGMLITRFSAALHDVQLASNTAFSGGALMVYDGSRVTISEALIDRNSVTYQGGAIQLLSSTIQIDRARVVGNRGSIATVLNAIDGRATMTNTLVSGNGAGWAFYLVGGGLSLINTTVSRNGLGNDVILMSRDGARTSIVNSIFWGNTAPEIPDIFGMDLTTTSVRHSMIEGGYPGEGNLASDPLFVDVDGPDDQPGTPDDAPRPGPGSPAIDAGDRTALAEAYTADLDGRARAVDDPATADTGIGTPPIDIGAYEYQLPPLEPDLTADVRVGRPGSAFIIRGYGFAAGADLQATWDGLPLGQVQANAQGELLMFVETSARTAHGDHELAIMPQAEADAAALTGRVTITLRLDPMAGLHRPDRPASSQTLTSPPAERVYLPVL